MNNTALCECPSHIKTVLYEPLWLYFRCIFNYWCDSGDGSVGVSDFSQSTALIIFQQPLDGSHDLCMTFTVAQSMIYIHFGHVSLVMLAFNSKHHYILVKFYRAATMAADS